MSDDPNRDPDPALNPEDDPWNRYVEGGLQIQSDPTAGLDRLRDRLRTEMGIPSRRPWTWPLGAAAAAVLAAALSWIFLSSSPPDGRPLLDGRPVSRGQFVVAQNQPVRLEMGGYCLVRLDPGSAITIEGREKAEQVFLERGKVTCDVHKQVGSFVIRTDVGTVTVKGTRFEARLEETGKKNTVDSRALVVTVFAGAVLLSGPAGERLVGAGESATITPVPAVPATADARKVDPSTLPMIFWHSQPVRPNETLMLSGANLTPGTQVEVCKLPDGKAGQPTAFDPAAKGLSWQPLGLLQLTPQLAQAVMPAGKEGVYACRVRNGDLIGAARLVNAPDVWFAQGDQGETASPGGWIGVFGTCIAANSNPLPVGIRTGTGKPKSSLPRPAALPKAAPSEPQTLLALVARGQTVRVLTSRPSGGTRYGQFFDLPADCPLGTYELFVHNGCGGPHGWTRLADHYNEQPITTITVAVPEEWPNTGVDVTKLPGGNDDERFAKAIAACRSGGIIFVPSGTYRLTQPLVLPHRTLLRGAGMDKTKLEWTADPKDGKGQHLPLIRGDAVSSKNGFDKRASFSLEDLSITASPTHEGHVIVREHTSVPAHFRRVAARCPLQTRVPERFILDMRYARNTEITECIWDAFYVIGLYKEVSHLRCNDNHFRWRGQTVSLLRHHNNILFAHNRITMAGTLTGNGYTVAMNANPGFAYAGHDYSNCRNLYYAHNISDREEAEPPHGSIGITFDGATAAYSGRIASVAGTKISLVGSTLGANQYGHPPCHPGASVRIVSGRGAGQWRYLTSKQTVNVKELEVDRAWDVEPDAGSWLAVSNVLGRTLFVGNKFSNDALLQTYFGTGDVVWAENAIGVPGKKVGMPVWVDVGRNVWHYQVIDNHVTELGVDMGCAQPDWHTPKDYTGPVTGTHVYRNNRVTDAKASFTINLPSRIIGFVVEGNQGLSALQARNVKDALGLLRHNTTLKGAVLKPEVPADQKILVLP